MAHQAVEECLNLYSRERKKLLREIKEELKRDEGIPSTNQLDDILNRGV